MVNVEARLKLKGKSYEILVDCDKAIALRKQRKFEAASMRDVLAINAIYSDYKKGLRHSSSELKAAFGTDNIDEIAARILAEGELLLPQSYREKELEAKFKQIVDFLVRNCIDPRTNAPYTPERVESALKQLGVKIDATRGADEQALNIIKELERIMPIRIETKKIKLIVPPAYAVRVYSLLKPLKREEEWLSDGSLSCIIHLPAGMQLEFYDKLNAITRGAATTAEVKE